MISIIVPIYNLSKYLSKCVDSILNQTYNNIEVVLVDDGSTDGSGEVCDGYVTNDKRVRVIHHMSNKGLTVARKSGINAAKGEFIGFVDPDDWIEPDMMEKMNCYALEYNAQIVATGMYRDSDEGTYAKWNAGKCDVGLYKGGELLEFQKGILCNGYAMISGSLNNKIIKKELLNNACKYVDSRLCGIDDDVAMLLPCIWMADTIFITNEAYYHGYDRADSATHTVHEDGIMQCNIFFSGIKKFLLENDRRIEENVMKELESFYIRCVKDQIRKMFPLRYDYRYVGELAEGDRIILYGAGKVGRNYYYQLSSMKNISVVAWVDKRYKNMRKEGLNVSGVESVKNGDYDYILIACYKEQIAGEIRDELVNIYGVDKGSIRWDRPVEALLI